MRYTMKWISSAGPDKFEYTEFQMEKDPDPPGVWKVRYRVDRRGEKSDYWTILPKRNRPGQSYMRRQEILDRDLACTAVGMTCELLRIEERVEIEPLQLQLIRVALQIERSSAQLENRKPRKLVSVYESV